MNTKNVSHLFLLIIAPLVLPAQRGLTNFPELIMTDIPGAPKLGKPILVKGASSEVTSQGHGLAAPAFYDWDGDGIKDLLIGEFGSGMEFGRYMGSFIRVYINIGTETEPEFTGNFDYARPPFEYQVKAHGTPYSIDQFCCMSFAPQFIDLDGDGYEDIITGHYQGEVSWFRGSEKGFIPGEVLPQHGDPRDKSVLKAFVKEQPYWLYSSASAGDFTGDGLSDLIIGGRALRISKNSGTLTAPQFAQRDLLLDVNGNPLKVYEYTTAELTEFGKKEPYVAGDYKLSPFVVDWDSDGVLDILVTNAYNHKGLATIDFFRGVRIGGEYRFEPAKPLFTAKDGSKALPGSSPLVFVTDYNNDDINDLLIGVSIVTMNGSFSDLLSWTWENNMEMHGAGKDPAKLDEKQLAAYKNYVKLPPGVTIDDYMTMRHKGYVYVMLGSKEESKPAPVKKQKTTKK